MAKAGNRETKPAGEWREKLGGDYFQLFKLEFFLKDLWKHTIWHPRWIVCKMCFVQSPDTSHQQQTAIYGGRGAGVQSLSFESQLAEETPRLTGTRWGNLSFLCLCTDGIMGKNWLMLSSQTLAQPSNRIYIYLFSFFFFFFFSNPWNIYGFTDWELHFWHVYHTDAWKRLSELAWCKQRCWGVMWQPKEHIWQV